MKRILSAGLLCCLLLCGCEARGENDTAIDDTQTDTELGTQTAPPEQEEDSTLRLAYYQSLVGELQQELLSIKTELYTSRVEYESEIARLEAELAKKENGEKEGTDEEEFLYVIENGRVTLTAYKGTRDTVNVPSRIEGCPVVALGDRFFADRSELRTVILPDSIESIGWFAFSGCVSLEQVSLPQGLESIAYGAFLNCPAALTLICSRGSYAEQYAKSYGICVKYE